MRVSVLLFAAAAESADRAKIRLDLPAPCTVAGLLDELAERWPRLGPLRGSLLVAVGRRYVRPGHELADGDEVALIPPVSGG